MEPGQRTAAGPRILLLEDEPLVALTVEELLSDIGCEVVGPLVSIDEALEVLTGEPVDAAILDYLVQGGESWPVASYLMTLGVPFALATGYPVDELPAHWQTCPRLQKPYKMQELEKLLRQFLPGRI